MRKLTGVLFALAALAVVPSAAAGGWTTSIPFTNVVATTPTSGAGYPVPAGSRVPEAGTCGAGPFNANHSESWIAVKPGTEDLVGSSKFFFDKYSTFYMFYLGATQIFGGTPSGNNQIQGYDCLSTGTNGQLNQDMPPSWTDTTDPNVDFDTAGRVYQTMLPFNSFFDATKLHPDGEIDMSYSDDMGQHWVKGNGGVALEPPNNASAKQLGHVEDKQWVAVNHIVGNVNQDHVYAAWAVFNGNGGGIKVRMAVSRDRGLTFDKAVTITPPSDVGAGATYVYPEIDAAGYVYVAVVSFPPNGGAHTIYVARSVDDGRTFGPFVPITTVTIPPGEVYPNTRFRSGIAENFAASPTYPGHLYLTFEDWDPVAGQADVMFTQSTDGGFTWTTPVVVNDSVDASGSPTDQFQPSVAAGPGGAVAVAFYDRRRACPSNPSVLPADVGRTNFCIDTSLQAYKDSGSRAVAVGSNVRISKYTWDPEQPGQHLGGLSQYPCAGARDPCPNGSGFIGDYFGLAISSGNIYGFFVSTHYPSTVTADEGGLIYYQQQVLAKVPRSDFGAGY
ncbi:MAG: exo-alpha-sialidase [Actinobacteria bacterium]|nr:MAG: exo-alpha-sialidase [Actinomycetota bacterium]